MRPSWKFSLSLILLVGSIVSLWFLKQGTTAYAIMFAVALVLTVLTAFFHRKVIRPLKSIANGVDMLREQDFTSRLAHVGDTEADRVVDMFNAMMKSLKLERRKQREQDYFLATLIDVSPMGILILDDCGVITGANPAAAHFLDSDNQEELRGLRPDDRETRLGTVLSSLRDNEVKVARLNDSMIYRCSRLTFMENGKHHPFLLIEKLTDEVMRAERKSYEKVIRMMAHEVNNSLAGLITTVNTAAAETDDPDLKEALNVSERRCRDMGTFITRFASAVKIPEPVRVSVDLVRKLRDWSPTLESVCSVTGSVFTMSLPDAKVAAMIDAVQIEQVLINIVKNAAESAGEGGKVTLRLDADGPVILVEDNGPGIDSEAADMLFVPFFTTKPSGHGFGLLLVSEVLNAHQFRFSLETCRDGITRFRISFG